MKAPSKSVKELSREISFLKKRIRELEESAGRTAEVREILRSTEENYRRYIDESPLGVRIVTREGETLYANQALLKMYGYESLEDLQSVPVQQRYTEESFAAHQERRAARKRGDIGATEYVVDILDRRGEIRHLQVHRKVMVWDGQPRYQVTYIDVTERVRAEEMEKAARLRLYSVLETLPVYVILLAPDYRVPFANRFFRERFGESGGRRCFEFLFNRTEPCEPCETYSVLKTGRPHRWEWTGPDGRNYDIFDFPFVEDDGSTCVMEVGIDITDMKRAQSALEEAKDLLELRVSQRTADLEAANEELEAFAYSVSHDLRTPLRAIDGFTRMLARDLGERLDDEGRRKIGVIRSGVKGMNQLIDDLLSISRLGRQAMSLTSVDMRSLAEEVWAECLDSAPGRALTLEIAPLPAACGDRALLKQALSNLLFNAVKFTRLRPSALVEVGGSRGRDENVYYVKDNGVGFDMRYYDKIFRVFQRVHAPDEYEGTGVGLAIVQRIVHRHGGRVWAESAIDRGATFYFSLPAPPSESTPEK